MPTIAISGYYGAGNAGDEIILAAMLQALRRAAPGAEFVVFSADPLLTAAGHGVTAVGRSPRHLGAMVHALRRADLFLSGGGGLLQESYPPRFLPASVLYYTGVCALAKLCGCRTMFYAQGIGPLRSGLARRLVRGTAEGMDLIAVRDGESAALLRDLGVSRPPVHVTADPALAWEPEGEAANPLAGVPAPLVIAVRPWPGGGGHLRAVAAAADLATREGGMTPVLLPLARGVDAAAGLRVRELMAEGERAIVLPELPIGQVRAAVAGAELVLGMRLHSLILAATAGVPPVGLAYDPKVAAFLRQIDPAGRICPLEADGGTIWGLLAAVRRERKRLTAALAARIPGLREAALRNAELAAGLLKKPCGSRRTRENNFSRN